jgi:membrane-associated protein
MRSLVYAVGLLDPEALIEKGGLLLLSLIVFAESGLLFGFFLPGDSLLFIAGFLTSEAGGNVLPPLWIVLFCVFVAAVLGDQIGYLFGNKVGPALFRRPDSRFFKQDHLVKAENFFARYGPKTIVLARFVPIVRTFAPIVAGAGSMHYRTFVTYNVLGALLWAVGVTAAGYFLGQIDIVKNNIEIALIVIVLVSIVPMVIEVLRHRRGRKTAEALMVEEQPASS